MQRFWVVSFAILALIVTNCSSSPPPQGAARPARIAVAEPTCTIRPGGFQGFSVVSYGIAETLTRPLPDGRVEPWLAEKVEQMSPTTWRIVLRSGVTFHNGKPMDAAAVVAALQDRAKTSFARDSIKTGTLEATGPLEVTLTTPQPSVSPPNDLATIYGYPIYDAAAATGAGKDEQALVKAGIYTGPFTPTAVGIQQISTRRFDRYWGKVPALPGVELLCIDDAQARLSAVQSGEADIALGPPPQARVALAGSNRATYVQSKTAADAAFLLLNLAQPPFDTTAVRQALALGIDYQALVAGVGGSLVAAHGLYPQGLPYAIDTYRTDRVAAAKLLDGAGWSPGPDGIRVKNGTPLKVRYLYSSKVDPDHKALGIALRDQLRALGVDLQLTETDNMYDDKGWPRDWNMANLALIMEGPGNDPSATLRRLSGQGQNFGKVQDPELDRLVTDLRATADPDRRNDILREIQRVVTNDADGVVLGFKTSDAAVSPRYRDYVSNPKLIFVTPDLRPAS